MSDQNQRIRLYEALKQLSHAQFGELTLRLPIDRAHIPSAQAALADRATALIQLVDQEPDGLRQLSDALQAIALGHFGAGAGAFVAVGDCEQAAQHLLETRNRAVLSTTIRRGFVQMARLPTPDHVLRDAKQDEIVSLLGHEDQPGSAASRRCVGLVGFGGYGKSALARAVAHDPRVRALYPDGVLWLQLSAQPRLVDAVRRVVRVLTGELRDFVDLADACQFLDGLIATRRYLFIIDDAWELAGLLEELSLLPGCGYLFTTRNRGLLPRYCEVVEVERFTHEEALALLTPAIVSDEHVAREALETLSNRLWGWPILIGLVGAHLDYLVESGSTLEAASTRVRRRLDEAGPDSFSDPDKSASIACVIDMSLDALSDDERSRAIALAVFPEDLDIPMRVVATLWDVPLQHAADLCARLRHRRILEQLSRSGNEPTSEAVVRLHDVIRADLRKRRKKDVHRATRSLLARFGVPLERFSDALLEGVETLDEYIVRFLPAHLVELEEWGALARTLCDFGYLRARCVLGDVFELEHELRAAASQVGQPAAQSLYKLWDRLRECTHILVESSTELPEVLYNRMIARGSKPGDIESKYWLPDGPPRLQLRAPLQQLHSAARVYKGHVHCTNDCVLVRDDTRLISASCDGTLRIWDVGTGRCERVLAAHNAIVDCCAATPDGSTIVSGSRNGVVVIWSGETGLPIRVLRDHQNKVRACAITEGGRLVVSASDDGTIRLYDLSLERDDFIALKEPGTFGTTPLFRRAILSRDGGTLAAIAGHRLYVYSVPRRVEIANVDVSLGGLSDCRFASGQDGIIIAGADGGARYDLQSRTLSRLFTASNGYSATYLGRGGAGEQYFCSTGRRIDVFSAIGKHPEAQLRGHSSGVKGCAVARDGSFIITCSSDRTLRRTPVRGGCSTTEAHKPILYIGQRPCGEYLSLAIDGRLDVRSSAEPERVLRSVDLETGRIERTGVSMAGDTLLVVDQFPHKHNTGAHTLLVRVDLATMRVDRFPTQHSLKSYAIAPSARWYVCARNTDLAYSVFGESLTRLGKDACRWLIKQVIVSMDETKVVTTHTGGIVRIADAANGDQFQVLWSNEHKVDVGMSCDINDTGRYVVTGGEDGGVALWDLAERSLRWTRIEHTDRVNHVVIDSAAGRIASASDDQTVRLWCIDSGALLACYRTEFWIESLAMRGDKVLAGDSEGNLHFLKFFARGSGLG